jgi:hypothetical protein
LEVWTKTHQYNPHYCRGWKNNAKILSAQSPSSITWS